MSMRLMHRKALRRRKAPGFTLIELMVTVAIIAILSTIAYASYQAYIIKARRATAQGCLMEVSQFMERHYTTAGNLSYAGAPDPTGACVTELQSFYTFGFSGTPNASSYVVQAEPTARQPDTLCGTMTVNQAGATTPTTDRCW